jgi:hypothetical protein
VRVGRAALDEEAIRLIEEHHPDIRFDWPQILKGEEEVEAPEPAEEPRLDPISPAHAQVGSEGLARLRARYADVLANISRRIPDEARRDALKAQAERLDPDSWVTADEVRAGLDQYESVLESLRSAIGRKRRRRRPRGAGTGPQGEPQVVDATEEIPETDSREDEEPDGA